MDNETLSFAELAEWSRQRWVAGQHEASDSVRARAEAQAKIEHKGKLVVRDTRTGVLELKGGGQKTQEELDNEELERLQKEEDAKKLATEQKRNQRK